MVHRGFEERGATRAGVLACGGDAVLKAALHIASQVRNITNHVTVYTNGNAALTTELTATMAPLGFHIDARHIARLEKGAGRAEVLLHLAAEDGSAPEEVVSEAFLVHRPLTRINNADVVARLGIETTELGFIKTSQPFYETSVPGVFAVGDAAVPFKIATHAIATGSFASNGLQMQLNEANVRRGLVTVT